MSGLPLNQNQRKILQWLNKHREDDIIITSETVREGIGAIKTPQFDDDMHLLEKDGFIKYYSDIDTVNLRITAEGARIAEETQWSVFWSTAKADPIKTMTMVFAALALIAAAVFYWQTLQLQNEVVQLQKENNDLAKPIIVPLQTSVDSGSITDINFKLVNPSLDKDYFVDTNLGTCSPQDKGVFEHPPEEQATSAPSYSSQASADAVAPPSPSFVKIPAGQSIPLSCSFYILPTTKNITTAMTFCVPVQNIEQPICKTVPITVLNAE